MTSKRTITDYKEQAKEHLLGNYGIAVGSFVLVLVIVYFITLILMGAASGLPTPAAGANGAHSVLDYLSKTVPQIIVELIVGIFTAIFMAGYLFVIRELSYGRSLERQNIFYAFSHHPDTVIIIAAVIELGRVILMLPGNILWYCYLGEDFSAKGQLVLIWTIVSLVGLFAYLYLYLTLAMSYLVYLDNPDFTAIECMRKSANLMKGQRFRYAYTLLSLVGYYLLGLLSLGIGLLWIYAYRNMILVEYYRDLIGDEKCEAEAANTEWNN